MEELAMAYATATNIYAREEILSDIMIKIKSYLKACINNAHNRSKRLGLYIPKEDFESYMTEGVWKAIETYNANGRYEINAIIKHRIRLAEIDASRKYRKPGNDTDKDGYTYVSARWYSLNRPVSNGQSSEELANYILGEAPSAEYVYTNKAEQIEIIETFGQSSKKNLRYANIIHSMWLGYEGDELATVTGEAEEYNGKMRTYVSRAKTSFKFFFI
jgi:DNA-directed RNA polymerase specialized sigma subunit